MFVIPIDIIPDHKLLIQILQSELLIGYYLEIVEHVNDFWYT